MATTKLTDTQSSGGDLLSDDAVNFYIAARLREHGKQKYHFRRAFTKEPIPAGNGTSIKFVRVPRIVLAGELTEATPPTAGVMTTEIITATATQFGQTIEVSDRVRLTLKHNLSRKAIEELAEAAGRKDDSIIQNVCLGASNVVYGGTSISSRGTLTSTSYTTTETLRNALMLLENTDDVDGEAPRMPNGMYGFLSNNRHMQDLLGDVDFKQTAFRAEPEALRRGVVRTWSDFEITKNTFGPKFTNLGASAAAVGVTEGTATSGGSLADDDYFYVITRRHLKRHFEENVSSTITKTLSGGGSTQVFTLQYSPGANYEWRVYTSTTSGSELLFGGWNASGDTVTVTSMPSGTASPPAAPASGITVYTSYGYAVGSVEVVDLDSLRSYVHTDPTKSDPLNQKAIFGTKWYDTAAIVNDLWIIRVEAPSRY